jgi:DNA-binding GntR family transcriptional regulator
MRSLWTLELLLLLAGDRDRDWSIEELVREMRSSAIAVREAVKDLQGAGLLGQESERYRFAPVSPDLEELAGHIRSAYAARPTAVVRAIFSAPEDKLRIFADAFRFRKE